MNEYISREATIDAIKKIYCPQCKNYNGAMCRACEHMDDMDIIEDMPSADVQPVKRGKWEYNDKPIFGNPYGRYCCSLCGSAMDSGEDNYCPCCGARMIKDGDTE